IAVQHATSTRTPADADHESRTRVHAGCSASGERELPLLRPQAGQEASLLHREHRRVSALRGDARLRHALIGGGTRLVALIGHPDARVYSRRGEWPPDSRGLDLVVNATPVRDELLVELGPGQTLVDLPYPRSATATAAAEAGARVLDGLDVLVSQGAAAFELC